MTPPDVTALPWSVDGAEVYALVGDGWTRLVAQCTGTDLAELIVAEHNAALDDVGGLG